MSEHEDRPAVDVEALRKAAEEAATLWDGHTWQPTEREIARADATVATVERLRERLAASGEAMSQWRTECLSARTARDEAIERATKAEQEVERLREDRLQMLAHTGRVVGQRDAARNERDEAQAVIADVRELAGRIAAEVEDGGDTCEDRSDCGPCWKGETAQRFATLLPDATGDDRG